MLFALVHFHIIHPIAIIHLTCVLPSLANDTHIVGLALDVVLVFFEIIGGLYIIRTFNITKKSVA